MLSTQRAAAAKQTGETQSVQKQSGRILQISENMADHLVVNIDGGHLYRYPSEVDPRKKATKVSQWRKSGKYP